MKGQNKFSAFLSLAKHISWFYHVNNPGTKWDSCRRKWKLQGIFPALRRTLWPWTHRGEVRALQSGHALHKGRDGERAFPEGWGRGWSCLRWHSTLTDCFSCALPRHPWKFTAGNFLWMPHSFHYSLTQHLPSLRLISPALFYSLPWSFHLQVLLHQPRNYDTNLIFFSYVYASSLYQSLSFPRCTTPNAGTPPKKFILVLKNQTDH